MNSQEASIQIQTAASSRVATYDEKRQLWISILTSIFSNLFFCPAVKLASSSVYKWKPAISKSNGKAFKHYSPFVNFISSSKNFNYWSL